MNELEASLALAVADKFTPLAMRKLFERFKSAANIVGATKAEILAVPKVAKGAPDALAEVVRSGKHLRELEECQKQGVSLLTLNDAGYPPALKTIFDPPVLLYVRGTLKPDDALALAIVGSRNASTYGNVQAARFARDFVMRGVCVVSGLARGIDTAAHKAALEARGRTIAVVGSGLLDIYPPENERLVRQIAEQGAVISEFPLHTPGVARNFPRRNRVISGLSLGVLVAEAGLRSGSLITARTAGEQGREVFAIPGKVDSEHSRGCHALIKEGVHLVEEPADVYAHIAAFKNLPRGDEAPLKPKLPPGLSPTEAALYVHLRPSDPITGDELIDKTGLPVPQVTSGLLTLELKRLAKCLPGKKYIRIDA
jgi:DNA processing protein